MTQCVLVNKAGGAIKKDLLWKNTNTKVSYPATDILDLPTSKLMEYKYLLVTYYLDTSNTILKSCLIDMTNIKATTGTFGYRIDVGEYYNDYSCIRWFTPMWNNQFYFNVGTCYNQNNVMQKNNNRIIPKEIYGIIGEPFGKE